MLKKLFKSLAKTVRQALFGTITIDTQPTVIGFCSRGERLGSILNTTKKSGNLELRSMVGGQWIELLRG